MSGTAGTPRPSLCCALNPIDDGSGPTEINGGVVSFNTTIDGNWSAGNRVLASVSVRFTAVPQGPNPYQPGPDKRSIIASNMNIAVTLRFTPPP